MASQPADLDRIDRQILVELQRNCRVPADGLAQRLAASASTILRRIQRLRDLGIIRREAAQLNAKLLGRPITIFLLVNLLGEDAAQVAAFARAVMDNPAVQQCFMVTGSADYILQLNVADMDEYDAFVSTLLVENPAVQASETRVVIRTLKQGLDVVIAP